jgi:ABC-type glutathione transport system ATPase component
MYIDKGEIVGIAGPSGSGKSLTMWSALGLIPAKAGISGSFRYYNVSGDALNIQNQKDARALTGRLISVIPQNPFTSLNPVFRCGVQIAEMLTSDPETSQKRKARVLRHLKDLGFEDAERIYAAYPFELSGGQLQRIVIAMATIGSPDLVIADEPTTALDVQTQNEVLDLLVNWIKAGNKSMFLVSHDISLLRRYCDRIYLMKHGEVLRSGSAEEMSQWMAKDQVSDDEISSEHTNDNDVLCSVTGISVHYLSRSGAYIDAGKQLSFSIRQGEALGIVGATGSGKSTLAKVLTGLVNPYQGTMTFMDRPLDFNRFPLLRSQIQMIFQDPYSALYPHLTVGAYFREAIRHHRITERANETTFITSLLGMVGLPVEFALRYPHQLSGGERQRVQIARAVGLKPKLLICDEITSGLDAEIQGQILQLISDLHKNTGIALMIISHDLNVIRYLSDRVLVLSDGNIVEHGEVNEIFSNPKHEVTRALLYAQYVGGTRRESEDK